MKKFRMNRSGFTLIELLVVIIIVAILVAVGIPLLQGNVRRAKLTEADAGLGTIRTAMRAYLAEHGNYNVGASPMTAATTPNLSNIGIKLRVTATSAGDLDGRFFSEEAYSVTNNGTTTPSTFCATVTGASSISTGTSIFTPRANEVNGTSGTALNRSMDDLGHLYNATVCTGTPVN